MSLPVVPTGTNLALLAGTLSRSPSVRTLPSGTTVASLELRTKPSDGPAETVPVSWFDPPATVGRLAEGDDLVVVGRVRRRFFRAGGATQSRTDVLATAVVPSRQAARARRLVADVVAQLRPDL